MLSFSSCSLGKHHAEADSKDGQQTSQLKHNGLRDISTSSGTWGGGARRSARGGSSGPRGSGRASGSRAWDSRWCQAANRVGGATVVDGGADTAGSASDHGEDGGHY